jgi:hypothetical protein
MGLTHFFLSLLVSALPPLSPTMSVVGMNSWHQIVQLVLAAAPLAFAQATSTTEPVGVEFAFLAPSAGETIFAGDIFTIRWAPAVPEPNTSYWLAYNTNGSFSAFDTQINLPSSMPDIELYTWTVPNTQSPGKYTIAMNIAATYPGIPIFTDSFESPVFVIQSQDVVVSTTSSDTTSLTSSASPIASMTSPTTASQTTTANTTVITSSTSPVRAVTSPNSSNTTLQVTSSGTKVTTSASVATTTAPGLGTTSGGGGGGGDLSAGAIAAITIGSFIATILGTVGTWYFGWRNRRAADSNSPQNVRIPLTPVRLPHTGP